MELTSAIEQYFSENVIGFLLVVIVIVLLTLLKFLDKKSF